jgi:alpha-beta hydrolase superfamily lysophospholipase
MPDLDFRFESRADGLSIQAYAWRAVGPTRGGVVLAHGAAEHALRYERFARALGAAGLEVWAADHRGHGRSVGPRGLGDAGTGGWAGLVADIVQLVRHARAARSGLPLALFGHSMGSFAVQALCLDHASEIDAAILSGSTLLDVPEPGAAPAPFAPNAAFEPARTPYDWLSRDPAEVDAYIADPCCGFDKVPVWSLLGGMDARRMADPAALKQIRADLPVLIVSGSDDPLHRGLRGLDLLEKRWREAGVRRIDVRTYPGARHELTNELNRDEVTRDVSAWIARALAL